MKNIAVIPHIEKDDWKENATKLIPVLLEHKASVFMDKGQQGLFNDLKAVNFVDLDECKEKIELIITLGGDGTIIRASKYAADNAIPLLGINIGHMGYLAELDTSEYHLLSRIFEGNYFFDERAMCDAEVIRKGEVIKTYLALNDVVITKGMISRPIPFTVIADKSYINSYLADGLVVATPTGSTAYSLSAGGPIMEPCTESIVLTPIAPHSLSTRPIVMSNLRTMRIVLGDLKFRDAYVTPDGALGFSLYTGDIVAVKKSAKVTKLVRIKKRGFYEILSEKL
jgi:NAD+ kinase